MSNTNDATTRNGKDLGSIAEVLSKLNGKSVVVCNPEALRGSPTGRLIGHAIYKAKVQSVGEDLLTLRTFFDPTGRGVDGEPAKEFIPFSYIKRVSVTPDETHIHL